MKQKIQNPASHDVRLIAVPEEKLNLSSGDCVPDIEVLEDEDTGQTYDVLEHYELNKSDEPWHIGLITLAVGQPLTRDEVFSVYTKSERIICFIAKLKTND